MNIVIRASQRGRFDALLEGRLLGTFTTPFYSAARILKAEGVLPQTPLTMTHEGSDTVCLSSTVGEAAGLSLVEADKGFQLRAYRPSPFARPE